MNILIKGLKMPTNQQARIILYPNGQLFVDHGTWFTEYEAIEFPDHGDLIDRDKMAEDLAYDIELDERALDDTDIAGIERENLQFDKDYKQNCIYYLMEQEIVIPAERDKDE